MTISQLRSIAPKVSRKPKTSRARQFFLVRWLATNRSHVWPLLAIVFLLMPILASADPQEAATLVFRFQQSEARLIDDEEGLFGVYLGTGDGVGTGALRGTVGWDLYEDQSRTDLHPAHFVGVLEREAERHSFQIVGVYTPSGGEKAIDPNGKEHPRYWTLSGAIVFDDETLLGVRQASVTGLVDIKTGTLRQTIWVQHDNTQ